MLSEEAILDFAKSFDGVEQGEMGVTAGKEPSFLDSSKNEEGNLPAGPASPLQVFKTNDRIFLIIHKNTNPLRIDLKCDYKLSRLLSERYETVQKSTLLGNKGIEVILTGQLPDEDIKDLISYSFHHA